MEAHKQVVHWGCGPREQERGMGRREGGGTSEGPRGLVDRPTGLSDNPGNATSEPSPRKTGRGSISFSSRPTRSPRGHSLAALLGFACTGARWTPVCAPPAPTLPLHTPGQGHRRRKQPEQDGQRGSQVAAERVWNNQRGSRAWGCPPCAILGSALALLSPSGMAGLPGQDLVPLRPNRMGCWGFPGFSLLPRKTGEAPSV